MSAQPQIKKPVKPVPPAKPVKPSLHTELPFALLDHAVESEKREGWKNPRRLGNLAKALGLVFPPDDRRLTLGSTLQEVIDEQLENDAILRETPFAVIDLTEKPPLYAGNRDTEMLDPGSMGKLVFMLGAFQLRFDLAVLAAKRGIADADADRLFDDFAPNLWARVGVSPRFKGMVQRLSDPRIELESNHSHSLFLHPETEFVNPIPIPERWDVVVLDGARVSMRTKVPSDYKEVEKDRLRSFSPRSEEARNGEYDFGPIRLARIFDRQKGVSPPRFSDDERQVDLLEIQHQEAPAREVQTLGFQKRLKLMIGFSNDPATESIVADMGMIYAHSPMWRAGLFDTKEGGIWIGEDFWQHGNDIQNKRLEGNPGLKLKLEPNQSITGGRVWRAPPFREPPCDPTNPFREPDCDATNRAATARALAILMAAICTDKVVDAASCGEMRELLNRGASYRRNEPGGPVWNALRFELKRLGENDIIYAKNAATTTEVGDAAFVIRHDSGKELKYALSIIGARGAEAVKRVVKAVDDAVLRLAKGEGVAQAFRRQSSSRRAV